MNKGITPSSGGDDDSVTSSGGPSRGRGRITKLLYFLSRSYIFGDCFSYFFGSGIIIFIGSNFSWNL